MSGIYIPGMEMPTSCFQCEFRTKIDPDNLMCIISQKTFEERFCHIEHRDESCPLVPVPEHGRLIEEKAIKNKIANHILDTEYAWGWNAAMKQCYEAVEDAPTIIPADKEGE